MSDLLNEEQAARRLMIGESTLRGLRRQGMIRYVALTARKIAYRPEDCDEYVERRLRIEPPRAESSDEPKRKAGRPSPRRGNVVPFSQRKKA